MRQKKTEITAKMARVDDSTSLRRQAEKIAREKAGLSQKKIEAMQPDEIRQTLHELQVHQIELEMQNEELLQKQKELDALRARYFDLYDLAPVGYLTVSEQGLILEANLTAATLLGVALSPLSKPQLTRFILKEDQDIYYLHRKQLFESGDHQRCELRMVKKNNTAFWAHLEAIVAQNSQGEPVCRVAISDISTLKQMEDELRESEGRYRLLAEHTKDIVWLMDMDVKPFYQSPSSEILRGYTTQELADLPLDKNFTPDSLKLAMEFLISEMPKIEADHGYDPVHILELEYYRKDGTTVWLENKFSVIRDESGKPVSIMGEGRDITERKKAETALKESEERFRALFDRSLYAVYIHDLEGNFIDANQYALDLLGFRRDEIKSINFGKLLSPDQIPLAIETAMKLIEGGKQSEITGYILKGKDGKGVHIETTATILYREGGPYAILGIALDVTKRKEIEAELIMSEKKYRELSIIDGLTRLYNSRHFYFQLKIELDRSNRYEQPLTLLLLDLDNFKQFNDVYGHVEGDQVLLRLSQVIKRCLRQTDSAYRYGGEEFTILLPVTTSEDGAVTAERIRTEFKKETFLPVPGQGEVHLTVSIGLGQYKPKEDTKVFVNRVDQLMYQAKNSGKDRVCSETL